MIDGRKLTKVATGLVMVGTLAMLPACGTGGGNDGGEGTDMAAGASQKADSSDDDAQAKSEKSDGTTGNEADMDDAVVAAGGGVTDGTGKDEYAPKPASGSKASKSGDTDDNGKEPQGSEAPVELHTNDSQIVLQYEGDEATRLVFHHDGDAITSFESYVDYGTEDVAKNVAMGLSDAHDGAIKSVRVEGSYVVTEHSPSTYEDLTVSTLGDTYPDAIRV